MDERRFWQLIDEAREKAGGAGDMDSAEEQAEHLEKLLSKEKPKDIVDFDRMFSERMARSYDWGVWGAAYVLNGGCSDDGFEYFRAWLIGQGQKVFEAVLANPDSLADHADDEVECEDLLYVASRAYEEKTGDEIPAATVDLSGGPKGEAWEEDDLPERFPRLSEKFG